MLKEIYSHLPEPLKPVAKSVYNRIFYSDPSTIEDDFIAIIFGDTKEFDRYCKEFDNEISDIHSKRIDEFYEMITESEATFAGMDINQARVLYTLIRSENPEYIVEAGVCNGVSTLVSLMALEKNGSGNLYSIDYPTFSNETAPEFQKNLYPEDHTFSAIPKDKEPGWIVPDRLRRRWELRTGKSQRKLPPLLSELECIDIFIHDSDHTFPCMMFEYELSWEYLSSDGILLSDDIHTNNAFDIFGEKRANQYGKACLNLGYALK